MFTFASGGAAERARKATKALPAASPAGMAIGRASGQTIPTLGLVAQATGVKSAGELQVTSTSTAVWLTNVKRLGKNARKRLRRINKQEEARQARADAAVMTNAIAQQQQQRMPGVSGAPPAVQASVPQKPVPAVLPLLAAAAAEEAPDFIPLETPTLPYKTLALCSKTPARQKKMTQRTKHLSTHLANAAKAIVGAQQRKRKRNEDDQCAPFYPLYSFIYLLHHALPQVIIISLHCGVSSFTCIKSKAVS